MGHIHVIGQLPVLILGQLWECFGAMFNSQCENGKLYFYFI